MVLGMSRRMTKLQCAPTQIQSQPVFGADDTIFRHSHKLAIQRPIGRLPVDGDNTRYQFCGIRQMTGTAGMNNQPGIGVTLH